MFPTILWKWSNLLRNCQPIFKLSLEKEKKQKKKLSLPWKYCNISSFINSSKSYINHLCCWTCLIIYLFSPRKSFCAGGIIPGDMAPGQVAMMPNSNQPAMMHLGPNSVNMQQQVSLLVTPSDTFLIWNKLITHYVFLFFRITWPFATTLPWTSWHDSKIWWTCSDWGCNWMLRSNRKWNINKSNRARYEVNWTWVLC